MAVGAIAEGQVEQFRQGAELVAEAPGRAGVVVLLQHETILEDLPDAVDREQDRQRHCQSGEGKHRHQRDARTHAILARGDEHHADEHQHADDKAAP